jgi:hypothetical protein
MNNLKDKLSDESQNQPSCLGSVSGSAYVAETRLCGDCKNFKLDAGANVMGTCGKKLMTVISSMYINYRKEDGSCFE